MRYHKPCWATLMIILVWIMGVAEAQTDNTALSSGEQQLAHDLSKYVRIHLISKVINAEKSGPAWIDKVNVVDSSIGLRVANKGITVREILASSQTPQEFTELLAQADSLIEFGVKVSLLPYGLRSHVKDVLFDSIDEQAQLKRESAERVVRQMVENQFNANPNVVGLPPEVVEQMKEQAVAQAMSGINTQINQSVAGKKQNFAKRVDAMALETTIKELYLGYAKVMGGGKGFVHVKIGKFRVGQRWMKMA